MATGGGDPRSGQEALPRPGDARVSACSEPLPPRQREDGQSPRAASFLPGGVSLAGHRAYCGSPPRDRAGPRAPMRSRISRRRGRGLARSWPRGGISLRGPGARPGDYGALPPTYIFPRLWWRVPTGMAAAGGAASRRGPGRPCPFSIEHILSSLPERSPPALAACPPQPAGRQSPVEPREPGAPKAAPCACCCCCGPRAAPGGSPEPAAGLGEWVRSAGVRGPGARRGRRGAALPAPCLTAPLPCRRAAAVAA